MGGSGGRGAQIPPCGGKPFSFLPLLPWEYRGTALKASPSSAEKRGLILFVCLWLCRPAAAPAFSVAVASAVAELRVLGCSGLSSCSAWARQLRLLAPGARA